MPLPKPPTSKATLLSATDYETQAAARTAKRQLHTPTDTAKEPWRLSPEPAPVAAPRTETRPPASRTAPPMRLAPPAAAAAEAVKPRARREAGAARLFVLDTNVLMHD